MDKIMSASYELDSKTSSKIKAKIAKSSSHKLFDGFKGDKTINEVLDKPAIMTVYGMIKSGIISYVNGAVSAGKESVVFWAVDGKGVDIALKIHLVTTTNFKNRMSYIDGDHRFGKIKKGTRNMVNLWARKEFTNMVLCYNKGIHVPEPIQISKNVIASRFIGSKGLPQKTLHTSQISNKDYVETVSIIKKMYLKAGLVHGDLSEYNIFKDPSGLIVFDLGSGVNKKHPNALGFLKRDINNITRFFVKRGLIVKNPIDVLKEVIE
ncbi:MAG: non-specific serine/threonine protein kinase, RIO kinase 1 [Cenarchaeum symbiont of Oopsacas minuta]|nr:non-specific serine/threonine protein kinase, RIO kinase 1 [Cenarchaeum symbiont of Oopsacas minuta]